MDLPEELQRLAVEQYGVVSRAQTLQSGVSAPEVRWRLGRSWRLVLPGVLLLSPGLPSTRQRQIAALLYAGADSWLAGPTALDLHGRPSSRTIPRIHALVPPTHRSRDVRWLSIRRTAFVDERIIERGALRFSCLSRAVVDTAALSADDADCRALLIDAIQNRTVRLDDVSHWIDARRPNGSARLRRAVAEAAAGAWSVPEADLARIVARSSTLPPAWLNPELRDSRGRRLTTPDLWIDDVAMAVMVHSRAFHAGVLDWEATVEQDADLSANGVVVVGVTPGAIARDGRRVLQRIEEAYLRARAIGRRADVAATPRIVPAAQILGGDVPNVRVMGS